jgi:hypothetical protein
MGLLTQLNAKVIAGSCGQNYLWKSEDALHAIYDQVHAELLSDDSFGVGRAAEILLGPDGADILREFASMPYVPPTP